MSNAKKFAEEELKILVESNTDPENRPIIEEFIPEIIALVDKFGNSGQSGGSAPYVANAISNAVKKLCLFEPICPITGIDSEWGNIFDMGGDPIYQNKRCSGLFKWKDNSISYVDSIVWKDENGHCWSGSATLLNGESLSSSQNIKRFPFESKTFYIDVISKEEPKDNWEFFVKDEKQLDEVFEYYDKR